MKILAVDTSSMVSSIAVLEDDKVLGAFSLSQDKTHAEVLIPMVETLLGSFDLRINEIDLFAVGIGPGSFTGLRIGMSAIKSIAQVLDKKIIGVSILEAMAYSNITKDTSLALVDARGKRYFAGLYTYEQGKIVAQKEEALYKENTIIDFINGFEENLIVLGNDIERIKDQVKNAKVLFSNTDLSHTYAASIGKLAYEKALEEKFDSYFDLAPNYIRKSQAELDFEKRNKTS